jgi:hypothetical protein
MGCFRAKGVPRGLYQYEAPSPLSTSTPGSTVHYGLTSTVKPEPGALIPMALLKAHGAFDHSNEALEVAPTICAATKDPNSDDDPATLKFLRLVAGLRYSITARKPDFPRFLELPRELRDIIYAHYLDDNMLYRWDFCMLPILKSVGWEPQLFSASHQVRCEAFEVYLRKATSIGIVSLWRAEEFMRILGSFPTSRPFELVRDIRLFNIHVLEWVV